MIFAKTTKNTKYNDKVVVNVDDDKVVYYDSYFDIIIVNDCQNVYDFDDDKVKVINDKDFVDILVNKDNVERIDCLKSHYQYKNLLELSKEFIDDNKRIMTTIKSINDDIVVNNVNLKNFDNINKYIKIVDFVDNNDFKVISDNLKDDNVFLLHSNIKDNVVDFKNNYYVLLSMNKDIYNYNYFDFVDKIIVSYVIYHYDNDNVKVLINLNDLNIFLNNFDYNLTVLKNRQSQQFLINQINKNYDLLNKLSIEYKYLINKECKTINCQQNKNNKVKRLIKKGQSVKKSIKKDKQRFNLIKDNKVNYDNLNDFDIDNLNIKEFNSIKQYIVKQNCYFNDLNKLKNLTYLTFRHNFLDFDLKDSLKNINKDNVNKSFKTNCFLRIDDDFDDDFDDIVVNNKVLKYDNNIVVKDDDDFDFDIDLTVDKDFDIDIDFNNIDFDFNVDDDDFINDIINDINLFLKDISYNTTYDIKKTNIINRLNFDLNKYEYLFNECFKNDDDYFDNSDIYKLYIDFLNVVIDFVNNLKIDNVDSIDDFDIYDNDIFKSTMNKHNSIIKKEQSDFLKVSFNEDMTDFYMTD